MNRHIQNLVTLFAKWLLMPSFAPLLYFSLGALALVGCLEHSIHWSYAFIVLLGLFGPSLVPQRFLGYYRASTAPSGTVKYRRELAYTRASYNPVAYASVSIIAVCAHQALAWNSLEWILAAASIAVLQWTLIVYMEIASIKSIDAFYAKEPIGTLL